MQDDGTMNDGFGFRFRDRIQVGFGFRVCGFVSALIVAYFSAAFGTKAAEIQRKCIVPPRRTGVLGITVLFG